jgi:ribosome-associated protein YbcJ (S4-like RNA binding protein)
MIKWLKAKRFGVGPVSQAHGLVRSAERAKHLIQEGQVQVNGGGETHRSRQLVSGDAV